MRITTNYYLPNHNIQNSKSKNVSNPSFNGRGKYFIPTMIPVALAVNELLTGKGLEVQKNQDDLDKNFQFRDLSDEEFTALVEEVKNRKYGDFRKHLQDKNKEDFSIWSAQLFDYISQYINGCDRDDPVLRLCNRYVIYQSENRGYQVKTKESAELVKKMIGMAWLFAPGGQLDYVQHTLGMDTSNLNEEQMQIKQSLLDKIQKNRKKIEKNFDGSKWKDLIAMIECVSSKEALDVAEKIIDHSELFDKEVFGKMSICLQHYPSKNTESHQIIRDYLNNIIDELIKNPQQSGNKDLASCLTVVAEYNPDGKTPERLELLARDIKRSYEYSGM